MGMESELLATMTKSFPSLPPAVAAREVVGRFPRSSRCLRRSRRLDFLYVAVLTTRNWVDGTPTRGQIPAVKSVCAMLLFFLAQTSCEKESTRRSSANHPAEGSDLSAASGVTHWNQVCESGERNLCSMYLWASLATHAAIPEWIYEEFGKQCQKDNFEMCSLAAEFASKNDLEAGDVRASLNAGCDKGDYYSCAELDREFDRPGPQMVRTCIESDFAFCHGWQWAELVELDKKAVAQLGDYYKANCLSGLWIHCFYVDEITREAALMKMRESCDAEQWVGCYFGALNANGNEVSEFAARVNKLHPDFGRDRQVGSIDESQTVIERDRSYYEQKRNEYEAAKVFYGAQ